MRSIRQMGTGAALLLAVTLLAYIPALRAGYVGDDEAYVRENDSLRSLDGLRQIWLDPPASPQYYPLTFTTFWIEYHLWGLDPLGYHAVNVVLHAMNVLVLWFLLQRLRVPGAWLASAIFALHPVHVESVAWITERKNVLSTLFFLFAVVAWLRFAAAPRRHRYALVVLLFAGALLSKSMTVTLPLVLFLLEWWQDPVRLRDRVPWLLALLPLSVGSICLTMWCEHLVDGSDMVTRALTFGDRSLIAARAFWFYLGKLLWPAPLMIYYPRWQIDVAVPWQYLFPVSAIAVFVLLARYRRQLTSGPLVAALFFVSTLGPVLGFVNFNFMAFSYVADHFAYVPSIGPITLFAAALVMMERAAALPRLLMRIAAAALLVVLGILTWRQAGFYWDDETLMRDSLAKNPRAAGAHYNLGTTLMRQGKVDEALPHYVEALRDMPDYADAHDGFGVVLLRQQKPQEALSHFMEAARLQPFAFAPQKYLGAALEMLGRDDEAIVYYTAAVRFNPSAADIHRELAMLLLKHNQLEDAATHFAAAVQCDPDDTVTRKRWARVLELQGKTDAAMEQYALVLQRDPADFTVQSRLAEYLFQHGRLEESIPHFAAAADLKSDQADVHNNWGAALGGVGRVSEAIEQFKEALRIKPDDIDAQANLQKALTQARTSGPDR